MNTNAENIDYSSKKSNVIYFNLTYYNTEQLSIYNQLLVVFEIIRPISLILSILGLLGNFALIYVILNTSFRHVSYGLLIITISFFDSIRLFSSIFYYLLFSNIIQINLRNVIIYLALDRYPVFVINWCKVLMSVERFLTVRYWEHHTHLDWRSKHKRKQYRRFIYSIVIVLISGLLIQHPNYLFKRYEYVQINYNRLILLIKPNENYFYGFIQFNEPLFTIISYILFDTTLPIIILLILNIIVLKEIRRLPLSLQVKVRESIGILLFITILSFAIIPRVFIVFYSLYLSNDDNYLFLKKIFIFFYICLGFEYFNHAITGYACFLSSALLRSELKNMIWSKYILHNIHH